MSIVTVVSYNIVFVCFLEGQGKKEGKLETMTNVGQSYLSLYKHSQNE